MFGDAFEAYLHHELSSWVDYRGEGELRYWRSASGYEVDFILDGEVAIECKAARSIAPGDCKGLKALDEDVPMKRKIVACFEPAPRKVDGIEVLPWQVLLDRLWGGEIL